MSPPRTGTPTHPPPARPERARTAARPAPAQRPHSAARPRSAHPRMARPRTVGAAASGAGTAASGRAPAFRGGSAGGACRAPARSLSSGSAVLRSPPDVRPAGVGPAETLGLGVTGRAGAGIPPTADAFCRAMVSTTRTAPTTTPTASDETISGVRSKSVTCTRSRPGGDSSAFRGGRARHHGCPRKGRRERQFPESQEGPRRRVDEVGSRRPVAEQVRDEEGRPP